MKQIPNIFRYIIERSNMSNNDEIVCYANKKGIKFPEHIGRVVICRDIFEEEGLDTKSVARLEYNKQSKLTSLLDAFFTIKKEIDFFNKKCGWNESQTLAHIIATDFYDCMSSGMPREKLRIIKYLCKNPKINKKEIVYIDATIETFLRDTNYVEDISELNLNEIKTLTLE